MKSRQILLLITLGICMQMCAQGSKYDTSTPEKFLISLGKAGSGPADENPIPYFYEKKSAEAITKYDEIGDVTLRNFQEFKATLATQFPSRVKSIDEEEIKVYVDEDQFMSRSFNLSLSLIAPQLKKRKPEDYVFISATPPSVDGKVMVSCEIEGEPIEFELRKIDGSYKFWMDENGLASLENMVTFFTEFNRVSEKWNEGLKNGELTEANFEEKITEWNEEYFAALAILN